MSHMVVYILSTKLSSSPRSVATATSRRKQAINLLFWVVLIQVGMVCSKVSACTHGVVQRSLFVHTTGNSACKTKFSISQVFRHGTTATTSYPKKYSIRQHHQTAFLVNNIRGGALLKGLCIPRGGSMDRDSFVNNATTARSFTNGASSVSPVKTYHKAYIAVGSNLGNRFENIASALKVLCPDDPTTTTNGTPSPTSSLPTVRLVRSSFLHETAPMYVTDQPSFLNGAVEIETTLGPMELLHKLKNIEEQLGRDFSGIRNGPRPVDLDIIMMWKQKSTNDEGDGATTVGEEPVIMDTPKLIIPHLRMSEREFVLLPLCDLGCDNLIHPVLNESIASLLQKLRDEQEQEKQEQKDVGDEEVPVAVQSLPLPRDRMLCFNETIVMGVLNVTPDSFSDGGKLKGSVDIAVQEAMRMVQDGAGIIDIGGESTRPGAEEVAIEEEMQRTIPVIEGIRKASCDVPISIDTRHAAVARAAIEAGADIVNDVSGGTFDPDMLSTVAELGVPLVLMHMRGTPETMQSMTGYDDIVLQVAESLLQRSRNAEKAGIPRWLQILDPGIGFAKDLEGNLLLLKHLSSKLKKELGESFPILLGTSRKGFIGKITGESVASERDYGSVASCIAAICIGNSSTDTLGCNILRVHNVKGTKQATMVMDAIRQV